MRLSCAGVGEAANGAHEALCPAGGADGHVLSINAACTLPTGDGKHAESCYCCSWVMLYWIRIFVDMINWLKAL